MKRAARIAAGILLAAACVEAQDNITREEFGRLKARIEELEKLVQAQQALLTQQQQTAAPKQAAPRNETPRPSALPTPIFTTRSAACEEPLKGNLITINGLLETELSYSRSRSDDSDARQEESDLVLATMELCLQARLHDWLRGHVALLWEEDETEPVDLDIATITLGDTESFPLSLEVGKMYVPFGHFDSAFITDPLVLELGETRGTAARLGFTSGPLDVCLALFNGDVADTDDASDNINTVLAAISFTHAWKSVSVAGGLAYTSNMADSDALQQAVADNAKGGVLDDRVGGLNAWLSLEAGPFCLVAEYLGATEAFDRNSLSFDGAGNDWSGAARPTAWNWEVAWCPNDRLTLAAKNEKAQDLHDWLPEKRYGACASYVLFDGPATTTVLSLEYLHGKYNDLVNTEEDTVALQLAVDF